MEKVKEEGENGEEEMVDPIFWICAALQLCDTYFSEMFLCL